MTGSKSRIQKEWETLKVRKGVSRKQLEAEEAEKDMEQFKPWLNIEKHYKDDHTHCIWILKNTIRWAKAHLDQVHL